MSGKACSKWALEPELRSTLWTTPTRRRRKSQPRGHEDKTESTPLVHTSETEQQQQRCANSSSYNHKPCQTLASRPQVAVCQASGRPFFGGWQLCRHPLAAGPCLMQLKAHQHHPHKRQREPHPKFCSATGEISLGGQIFTLSFVHHARLTFGKRQAAAEWEFKALEKAGIINCSTNSPCVKVFARYASVTILSALPH